MNTPFVNNHTARVHMEQKHPLSQNFDYLFSEIKRGFVTDFNRFLNRENFYLWRRKPKNNGPFLLTIALLEH